jgi:hypothetical protein
MNRFSGGPVLWLSALLTAALLTAAPLVTANPAPAFAAESPRFDPALIMSDDTFFNFQAMNQTQVQQFFETENCTRHDSSPCLARYRQKTRSIAAAPGVCDAYSGRRSESASSIVWRVAQACGINPQVLIVLLQKEQSLVTQPTASGYEKATGYACPDTADCDKRYLGFFNQVYRAAWQFRQYTLHPAEWRYRIGRVAIQYNPNKSCGASVVDIANQATANLYNYTPYQPNARTRAHPHGPAGPCAAFGNLNFFRIFSDWFGSSIAVRFGPWLPPCLNFVGGQNCPAVKPFNGQR